MSWLRSHDLLPMTVNTDVEVILCRPDKKKKKGLHLSSTDIWTCRSAILDIVFPVSNECPYYLHFTWKYNYLTTGCLDPCMFNIFCTNKIKTRNAAYTLMMILYSFCSLSDSSCCIMPYTACEIMSCDHFLWLRPHILQVHVCRSNTKGNNNLIKVCVIGWNATLWLCAR